MATRDGTAPSSPHLSELTLQNQVGFSNEKSDRNDKSDLEEGAATAQPQANPEVSGAPEGDRLTAWLVVLGAWCTSFCSFGWINSMYLCCVALGLANCDRCRSFPGVLPERSFKTILDEYDRMDPFVADLLHHGHGSCNRNPLR